MEASGKTIYYCEACQKAGTETNICEECKKEMEVTGWFEIDQSAPKKVSML